MSKSKKGPCWRGYEAIGMKEKNGRKNFFFMSFN